MLRSILFASAVSLGATGLAPAQPFDAGRSLEVDREATIDPTLLTPFDWREDVRFLVDRIRTVHPDPYRYRTEEAFDRAVSELEEMIPRLAPEEIVVGMLRLLALVRDGHTTMPMAFPGFGDAAVERLGFRRLPVRLYAFEDGVTVVASTGPHAELAGLRVVAIDGTPIERALELAMAASPVDNESAGRSHAVRLLEIPEILVGLGIADDADEVALAVEGADGGETVRLASIVEAADWVEARPAEGTPLHLRHPDRAYWSAYFPESDTMYVQYNEVRNQGDESIEVFFDRVFERAEREGAARMILDMRFNTGGNNALNWPIVYDILRSDRLNRRGRLFVVIGRRTFSAAQNGVNWLERHTNAVFVGEPTGAHPNHYGDAIGFELPNSGVPFQVSALYWQHHPRDDRRWTAPEIFAPPTAEAYLANRDDAIEAIETWESRPLFDRVVERLETGGIGAAVEAFRAFRADPRNRFVDVEDDLNRLGYLLVRSDRLEDAVEVFRLVVEIYPESANAHDSYGEGLWRSGDVEAAAAQYERAVELDPHGFVGRNARTMLERIRAGQPPP